MLEFSDSDGEEEEAGESGEEGGGRGVSKDDDDMGEPEPVPPHITSRAEVCLSICLSVCLSVHLSCLSVCLNHSVLARLCIYIFFTLPGKIQLGNPLNK